MMTLREWRHRRALSIEDLAKQAGVSTKTVSDIELGKVTPKFRTVRRIVGALGIEPGDVTEFVPRKGAGQGESA